MDKHKDDADPEKLATFEKNIALAFFYKGRDENAIEYFDKVLDRWNLGPPKNTIIRGLKIVYDLTMISLNLYLPFKRKGKSPNKRDNETFDFCYKKAISLANVDPMRNFMEQMGTVKRSFGFDLKKVENGVIFPSSASGCLSFAGLLPKLRKKLLELAEDIVSFNAPKELMEYELYFNFSNIFAGNLKDLKDYNENLIDENLRLGEFWHVTIYLFCFITLANEQGDFKASSILIEKLNGIADTYEYNFATVMCFLLKTVRDNKAGYFYDCIRECDEGISLCKQLGLEPYSIALLGQKAEAQMYLNDKEGAKSSLNFADELVKKQGFVPPTLSLGYLRGQQLHDLQLLEEAVSKDAKLLMPKCRKEAYHSCKKEIKNLKNMTFYSILSLNLFSRYYWLIDQQGKAIKLWKKAIDRAKDFGVEGPDLARTYMEIGRRLLEKKSKFKELNGIKAEEYFEKAREMFEKMDMQLDLDELERITSA